MGRARSHRKFELRPNRFADADTNHALAILISYDVTEEAPCLGQETGSSHFADAAVARAAIADRDAHPVTAQSTQ